MIGTKAKSIDKTLGGQSLNAFAASGCWLCRALHRAMYCHLGLFQKVLEVGINTARCFDILGGLDFHHGLPLSVYPEVTRTFPQASTRCFLLFTPELTGFT